MVTVDPGLDGTGWAVWSPNEVIPMASGSVSVSGMEAWEKRAYYTARGLAEAIDEFMFQSIVIEWPEHFTSAKGKAAAVRGDVHKIAYQCGVISAVIYGMAHVQANLLPVRDWKGQMPKSVVTRRIKKRLGSTACAKFGNTTHEWDAIGMGLHLKGEL
jgi:Holliday junction resolvasome RuvABC endonuclease subunit